LNFIFSFKVNPLNNSCFNSFCLYIEQFMFINVSYPR
jgi:hypothetical protein